MHLRTPHGHADLFRQPAAQSLEGGPKGGAAVLRGLGKPQRNRGRDADRAAGGDPRHDGTPDRDSEAGLRGHYSDLLAITTASGPDTEMTTRSLAAIGLPFTLPSTRRSTSVVR